MPSLKRALVVLLAVAVTACGGGDDSDPTQQFRDGVRNGVPCSELYTYRNELDPKDSVIEDYMNPTLRDIGCFTSGSERTDQ